MPTQIEIKKGMRTKTGKVLYQRSKYYISVDRRKIAIPQEVVLANAKLKMLVNKEVDVVFSNKRLSQIVAIIGGSNWKPVPILCNIPAPELLIKLQPEIQNMLLKKMVQDKIITPQFANSVKI